MKLQTKLFICIILISHIAFGQKLNNEITTEEKIYGLSKIWSEVNSDFANFDISKIDWDETYKTYINKALATKTIEEYYHELQKMVALLHDGHTNVYYPFANFRKPPLRTKLIENKVIVIGVYSDTLRNQNIEIGDEIIDINNTNAIEYGRINVIPYQSSSTIQDLNLRTYTYALLYGNADEKIELKIKKKDNSIHTASISRKLVSDKKYQTFELKILNDNIAYLKINDFENPNYKSIFDSLYVKILPSKALIIDLRENGGGNSKQGLYILSHLIEKTQ